MVKDNYRETDIIDSNPIKSLKIIIVIILKRKIFSLMKLRN